MNVPSADPSQPSSTTPTASSPRPRVEGHREQEILTGAITVLLEVGYDLLTFDAVAAEARASKATLYRRWKSKADLVVAAVDAAACSETAVNPPDTGSLKTDLLAIFTDPAKESTELSDVMAAVLPALHRDPEFTRAFTEKFFAPRQLGLRRVLEKAQARGEVGLGADLDLFAALLPAMKFHDVVVRNTRPTSARTRQVIEDILLPACAASRVNTDVGGDA